MCPSVPIDYEKFDLENLSLQDAISGITDFESSDLIFLEPGMLISQLYLVFFWGGGRSTALS
jgi:hypothetical protein